MKDKKTIKILGVCCSPWAAEGACKCMDGCLEAVAEASGRIETELIKLTVSDIDAHVEAGHLVGGLEHIDEHGLRSLTRALADGRVRGIIVGTPVHFGTVSAQCSALVDRSGMCGQNGCLFRYFISDGVAAQSLADLENAVTLKAAPADMLFHDMTHSADSEGRTHTGATVFDLADGGAKTSVSDLAALHNLGCRVAELACRYSDTAEK